MTVPSDGFVDFHFHTDLTFSANAGCGTGSPASFALAATIDHNPRMGTIEHWRTGADYSVTNEVTSIYLKAGAHTIDIFGRQFPCTPGDDGTVGTPTGTVTISNTHVLAYQDWRTCDRRVRLASFAALISSR